MATNKFRFKKRTNAPSKTFPTACKNEREKSLRFFAYNFEGRNRSSSQDHQTWLVREPRASRLAGRDGLNRWPEGPSRRRGPPGDRMPTREPLKTPPIDPNRSQPTENSHAQICTPRKGRRNKRYRGPRGVCWASLPPASCSSLAMESRTIGAPHQRASMRTSSPSETTSPAASKLTVFLSAGEPDFRHRPRP